MRAALLGCALFAFWVAGCSDGGSPDPNPTSVASPLTTGIDDLTIHDLRTALASGDTYAIAATRLNAYRCGGSTHPPGDFNESFTRDRVERTYVIHFPPWEDSDEPLPLVLNLHGFGSNARQQAAYSRFPEIADAEGFIVVTPDGAGTPQRWNNAGFDGEADDIGFIGALLDELEHELCIDTSRVYAAGISNGSVMAQRLACEMPGRFAAIAAVAALVYPTNCATDAPVPIIAFHGTADACVPYEGGRTACGRGNLPVPPVETALANWARHNGCGGEPERSQATAHVRLIAYRACRDGAEALLYVIEGGGHTWPGSAAVARLGETTDEIDATELIWAFFEAHEGRR